MQTSFVPLCMKNEMPFKSMLILADNRYNGLVEGRNKWYVTLLSLHRLCLT